MSAISRELQEQQGDMGAVMRKLFPDAPAISTPEEQRKIEEERKVRQARAESILAHVRELGDDY
jgi:hypothetical protein